MQELLAGAFSMTKRWWKCCQENQNVLVHTKAVLNLWMAAIARLIRKKLINSITATKGIRLQRNVTAEAGSVLEIDILLLTHFARSAKKIAC